MKVTNRSDGNVTYNLEEMHIRRVFAPNENKDIEVKELDTLFQLDGGAELIKHHLLVHDREWVEKRWDAPEEYFWTYEDVMNCVKNDTLELFAETLDFAPQGVIELIKMAAWRLPLTDLNKINVIRTKLNFDVQAAVQIMSTAAPAAEPKNPKARLRQRKED